MPLDQLIATIRQSSSITDVLRRLGFKSLNHSGAWTYINHVVHTNNLYEYVASHRRTRHSYSTEEAISAIKESTTWTDALRMIGLTNHGHNHRTLQRIAREHKIDTSHYNARSGRLRRNPEYTFTQIFCTNSNYSRNRLSHAIRRFDLIDYKCALCDNCGSWQNKRLVLTVDHKNGIPNDNRIDNLRYLCPNCHSQTETFGGKKRL